MTPDFYITEYTDDGVNYVKQVGSGRDVVDFAIDRQTCGEPHEQLEVLKDTVGKLLERAAINPRDMLDLCGLQNFDVGNL